MKIHQSKFLKSLFKNMKGCSLAYLHERVCTETESKDPEQPECVRGQLVQYSRNVSLTT